jgi:RNA polymerase sigma-70 factor, ECF subfamily
MATSPAPTPATWLEEHGDYLYRYALLQLRDSAAAEDAVQETLLAALSAWARFSGQSSVRTWLTGILKHKILDTFRAQAREPQFESLHGDGEDDLDALDRLLFDQTGHWVDPPKAWGDPAASLDQQRFWAALQRCLEGLPPQLAAAFSLRELGGLETGEICKELNITTTNCWVMLHRARVGLQQCLETHWGE